MLYLPTHETEMYVFAYLRVCETEDEAKDICDAHAAAGFQPFSQGYEVYSLTVGKEPVLVCSRDQKNAEWCKED